MLIRRVGETLVINDNIRVTIKKIRGQLIDMSIDAPKEIKIHRMEVQERINKKDLDINK